MKSLLLLLFTLTALFYQTSLSAQAISSHAIQIDFDQERLRKELFFPGEKQVLRLCSLKKGETYTVWASQVNGCSPTLSLSMTGQSGKTFSFTATSDCMELTMYRDMNNADCHDGSVWLSIATEKGKEKKNILEKMANLSVQGGFTDQYLIQEVFIGGGCFDVTGVSGVGGPNTKGTFANGGSSIFIDEGVIISTGNINNAPGPNNSNSAGNNAGGGNSDPDLQLLAAGSLHDVTGIEFMFKPTISTINFNYVFASEEYCEFVNSSFNDVFGFFISGPGISGGFQFNGQNIAVIPNTATPIAINNVNHLQNTGFFIGNQTNCGSTWNMADIQFDGFTSVLTAVANVVPCETYRIRLMIADVGDGIYDSAVFLQANSFSAGGTATGAASALASGTNIIYENCNDGSLIFTRAGGNTNMPLILNYTISPLSTATPGVDYTPLPGTVVIPPGFTSWSVPINVFNDNIIEGVETIIISVTNSCSCSSLNIEIQIHDPPPLSASLPDFSVCEATPIILEPTVVGGIPNQPNTYLWGAGSSAPFLPIVPITSGAYTVTVTDFCGTTATATSNISVSPLPTAIITGTTFLCPSQQGSAAQINIDFTGVGPWEFIILKDGIPQAPIVTNTNPYLYTTTQPGTYQLQSVTAITGNCLGLAAGIALVVVSDLTTSAVTTPASCVGNGTMTAVPIGGAPPYSYAWSTGFPNEQTAIGLLPGSYTVTVTDGAGCTATASATVGSTPSMSATANSPTGTNCNNPTGGSINVDITGGSQPFNFNWTSGLGNVQNPTGLPGGTYTVTITDAIGCTSTASATVSSDLTPPLAIASVPGLLTCAITSIDVSGTGSSTGAGYSYQWTGPGVTGAGNTINAPVNAPGNYTLTVTNQSNGCTATADVIVNADQSVPTAIAVGGEMTCAVNQINLDGTLSTSGPTIEYNWSGPGIVSGGNTATPTVNQAGNYVLTVTDLSNGCSATTPAQVTLNDMLPTASITAPTPLTCSTTSVTLNGTASSAGPNFTYQWLLGNTPVPGETGPTMNAGTTGTYNLVVTNQDNGCTAVQSVTVTNDLTPPDISATAGDEITCTNTSTTVIGSVAGNTANYNFAWSTQDGDILGGGNAATATVGAPGTYELIVTSLLNGCTATASALVTQDASIPEVEIAGVVELNCLTTQLQLNANNSSQGATLTYTWATQGGNFVSGQNTLTPTVNAPGVYSLTIFDSSNSCETTGSVTISQDIAAPGVNMPAPATLDCNVTSLTLGATVPNAPGADLTYQWSSLDGLIDGPADVLVPAISTPGTYAIVVTNTANGCTSQGSVTIGQDIAAPVVQVAAPDQLTCATNTATLNGSGTSTGANFTYQWTTSNGNFVSGAGTLNPTVDAPGTYSILVTNTANGCTQTTSVTVDEDTVAPAASAGTPATLTCAVQQLPLTGSGSTGAQFAYSWTGPGIVSGGSTLSPVVNMPGTYNLLVTNLTNACTATAAVAIGQDIAPPVAVAGTGGELSCTVTQLALNAAGSSTGNNFTYQWVSPDGNIASGDTGLAPTVNAPGTYQIIVTNTINGCTATSQVAVTQDDDLPPVSVASAQPITCLVNEVTLDGAGSAAGPNFIYQWSTANGSITSGAGTLNPVVNAPGIYVLTVTNTATNCTNLGSVTVQAQTNPPAAEAGPASQLTCTQTSLMLDGAGSASGSNFTYSWTSVDGIILSGANTLTPMIGSPGTYTILVTNTVTGCTNTDQVTIAQSVDVPQAAANTPGTLTCNVLTLTLNAAGTSTGSDFTYQWTTTNGNIVSGATSLSPVVNQPGTYQLLVTNTANGCTNTVQTLVPQDVQPPTAVAGTADLLTCTVQSVSLNGSGSSAGPNYTYQWSTINGNILTGGTSLTPVVNQTGTYTLLVTNSTNGCTAQSQVVVNQDASIPQAVIVQPGQLNCNITEITLSASATQGADMQYLWTTQGGYIISGASTLTPSINAPGVYLLTVTNTANGCTKAAQVTVAQDIATPNADAGAAFVMDCFDEINYLDGSASTGSGTISYLWQTVNGQIVAGSNTAQPGVSEPGTYLLTVTNLANGCTDTDQVTITRDGPSVEPETIQPPCFGDRGTINLSGAAGGQQPYLYSINGGNNYGTQAIFANLQPGMYDVVVQDAKGCEFKTNAQIEQPNQFKIAVEPQVELTLGDSYQINTLINFPPDEIQQVTWFPSATLSCDDCLDPLATPLTTTLYKVTVVTKNGCKDTAPILFRVNKRGGVFVPNAFSPNGDGTNDKFMIFSDPKSVVKVKSFLVFNRWGETVFEYYNFVPNDPAYGWDGTHRGQPMDPAVFTWFALIEFIDGRTEIFQGDVTLMN